MNRGLRREMNIMEESKDCTCGECDECQAREDFEIIDECVEEITQELLEALEDLSDEDCFHCFVKDFLIKAYYVGHEDGAKSLAHSVANSMMNIIEQ